MNMMAFGRASDYDDAIWLAFLNYYGPYSHDFIAPIITHIQETII